MLSLSYLLEDPGRTNVYHSCTADLLLMVGRRLLWSSGACFARVEWSLCPLFWCAGGVGSASTTRGTPFDNASFEHKYCESIHQIQNGSTSNSGSWKGTLFQYVGPHNWYQPRAKDQGRSPSQIKWIEMIIQQEDSWHTKSNSSDSSAWNYLSFVGLPITCPKSPLHVCSYQKLYVYNILKLQYMYIWKYKW